MADVLPVNLPPAEAVAFFRRKGLAKSFAWQDVYAEEHARAFTAAKCMQLDVLQDLRDGIERALAEGITLEQFRKELTPLLQAKGWWGRGKMVDPADGEEKEVRLGSPRRLATIYDTNLRTAHAAGQWERIQRTAERRPFLRYIHTDNANPRQQHKAWHGLVLPVSAEFWRTNYPPNGWGCHCAVMQLSPRDLDRYGYKVTEPEPRLELVRWENPRTGAVRLVPRGVDPGFDYNPGGAAEGAARIFGERLATSAADVGAAVWGDAGRELGGALQGGFKRWAEALESGAAAPSGDLFPVGGFSPRVLAGIRAEGREPASAGIMVRDRDLARMLRKAGQLGLFDGDPAAQLRQLPAHMARARAVLYDRAAGSLLYVLDVPRKAGAGELVVRVALQLAKGKPAPNRVAGAELIGREVLDDPAAVAVLEGQV